MRHDAARDAFVKTNFSRGLYAFQKYGITYEPLGGFRWTWKNVLYTIQKTEGVWCSARLLSANFCRGIVAYWIIGCGIVLSTTVKEDYSKDNVTAKVGFLIDDVFAHVDKETIAAVHTAANQALESLYPASESMVMVPILVGVLVAFLVAMNLAREFIPNVISTILKLRCGLIPLRGNPLLRDYRVAPESVAILTGSLFWGALASSVFTGGMIGLIVFFFMWQATAIFAQQFLAIVIGILVITLLRLAILTTLRTNFFVGFYRKRPAAANFSILALEWSSFALGTGFIFVRMIKLFFISVFSIGRIDAPLLAPGVGKLSELCFVFVLTQRLTKCVLR
jgi:hypothetical protein